MTPVCHYFLQENATLQALLYLNPITENFHDPD
jgi:hypothetical protein